MLSESTGRVARRAAVLPVHRRPAPAGSGPASRRSPAAAWLLALGVVVLAGLALPAPAAAQYFGRNKVQYEDFDWRVFRSPHFDTYFYPAESIPTSDMARAAERWYERLSRLFNHTYDRRSIIFYANAADFQQTNVVGGELTEGTGGVTESLRERVIMPHTGVYEETNHVLGHELVHVFQYSLAAGTERGYSNLSRIPLWIIEGMAEYLSVGQVDPHTAMWLRDALRRDDIPTLEQLGNDPRFFPYRYGQAFWAYMGGRFGDASITEFYKEALRATVPAAFRRVYGVSMDSLSAQWHRQIRQDYNQYLVGRVPPDSVGITIVEQGSGRQGDQNISPVISADGRYLVYYSSRDLFGFSLFLADATTGRTLRRLTSVISNQHFDALSFIQSGAAFSPDNEKVAFVVYAEGDQELNVLDIESGDIEQRIRIEGVTAITDPSWSPDGRYIVISGNSGGTTDLYLYDTQTRQTRALTSGRNAELQPAWSPDGRYLVFSTDRGEPTDFEIMSFGTMRLAIMEVATGEIQLLPNIYSRKSINPQFAPDGRSIYFISDRDGFSDIYRYALSEQQLYRVTRVATGISGITDLSPALSVSRLTGRMVFSVFERAAYSIHRLEAAEAQGVPVPLTPGDQLAGHLPAIQPLQQSIVTTYLSDARTGLPIERDYPVVPFDRSFSLDYVGVPGVGVSVGGPFGAGAQGGVVAVWGDQLSNRQIGAIAQINGTFKDFGGQVFYQNVENRWNYGAILGRQPLLGVLGNYSVAEENGTPVEYFDRVLLRQYFDQASVFTQYPISRTRRFEFGGGFQRISYDIEVDRLVVVGNQIVDQRRFNDEAPPAINLGTANAAYVTDFSFNGFNGPIAGGRSRFEVAGNVGTIDFATVTADYRRYFFPRPLTIAFRAMHFGRYGPDADSLRPLFLGNGFFIRGYDFGSFSNVECTVVPGQQNACPEFDRLNGSRLAVANFEIRIPLFGPQPLYIVNFPYAPIDIVPFVDAGLAWTGSESPELRFDRNAIERVPVVSTGVSARINLFGFAVLETYYAYPFQRPEQGGYFTFQLLPAW